MPDYYKILEVEFDASFDQIKVAYRRKALQKHPDRGGSHAEMVTINEAWEVLSDSELRRQYDEQVRTGSTDHADFEEARQRSKNYERDWRKFDSWLSSIGRDFESAEFGSVKFFGWSLPTAKKSVSGRLFLITGGLAGLLIALALFSAFAGELDKNFSSGALMRMALFGCLASVAVGSWGGQWAHQKFGKHIARWMQNEMPFSFFNEKSATHNSGAVEPDIDESKSNEKSRSVTCPECSQKLRVPQLAKTLEITCPKCHTKFTFPITNNQQERNRMKFPPSNANLANLLRCLLIFEIVFSVISILIELVVGAMGEEILNEVGLVSPDVNMFVVAMAVMACLVLLPAAIASWVGLFQHKNWGRWLYLISLIVTNLLLVFLGCFTWTYSWDLLSALSSIGSVVNGLILSICFLSPLATEFGQSSDIGA